jgi:serine/threonine protein kinase/DNA-directed RNA polymerase subunit RPC12/RpoP
MGGHNLRKNLSFDQKLADAGAHAVDPSEPDKAAGDSKSHSIDETAMLDAAEPIPMKSKRRNRLPGDTFGRYRIRKILGEGAMGAVYLALDTQLDRKVALKIPKVDSSGDSKFIARFLREARAAATLSHPNICPVYDVGEIDDTHFIAMAYIQGQSLAEFVNSDKPQSDRSVAVVVRKVAVALNEAHNNGLIHRDVKPANVMIDHRNEPIIMDFGLARNVNDHDEARLTTEGAILGSPAYMSPEQVEGYVENIGPASDIYSLGVIFYELLTGELPFQGTIASIIAQIVTKPVKDPRKKRADISPRLAAICTKSMAKRIDDRYATMKTFANDLADYLKSTKTQGTADPAIAKQSAAAGEKLHQTSAPIEVTCSCGQRLVAKRHLAGKTVQCPRCNELNTMPAETVPSELQVDVSCDSCGQRFMASMELAGRVVKCTTCSQPIAVPKPGVKPQRTGQSRIDCECGKQFLANRELAGKRVRCPSCGSVLKIPRLS